MTAVNPTMTIDKPGATSASRSRWKSAEKSGRVSATKAGNSSVSDLVPAGVNDGARPMPNIEAKYTKVNWHKNNSFHKRRQID